MLLPYIHGRRKEEGLWPLPWQHFTSLLLFWGFFEPQRTRLQILQEICIKSQHVWQLHEKSHSQQSWTALAMQAPQRATGHPQSQHQREIKTSLRAASSSSPCINLIKEHWRTAARHSKLYFYKTPWSVKRLVGAIKQGLFETSHKG